MKTLCLYNDKGGVTKTTTAPNYAASLKNAYPHARVGLLDLCSDHGHLSKRYALDKEGMTESGEMCGAWAIMEALLDPRLKRDPANLANAIHKAVTPIRVVPGTEGEEGCIQFLNVSVGLSHNLRGATVFGAAETAKKKGEEFLDAIESILGLDYLVVDLPGMVDEAMVRAVLPHCYAVVIPVDVRNYMNMAEHDVLVAKLRDKEVDVAGFLRTFVEDGGQAPKVPSTDEKALPTAAKAPKVPKAQETADEVLLTLSQNTGVPILPGGIPNRVILPQSIEPEMGPDGLQQAGLYIYAAKKELNANMRGVVLRTIEAVEGAVKATLAGAEAVASIK